MENSKSNNQTFLQKYEEFIVLKQVLFESYLFGLTHYDIMYRFTNDRKYLDDKIEYIKMYGFK